MKKNLLLIIVILAAIFNHAVYSQNKETKKINPNHFDEQAAYEQAKSKGLPAGEIEGYVNFLRRDFSSKKALAKQPHIHSPYENGSTDIQETVIYLEPNKPMSLGCPNMAFEQYNFNGWTGSTGVVNTGPVGGNPIFSQAGAAILNPAGNNVSMLNTMNYHTIMTIPATNRVYPTCAGYDSLAVRAVGSTTVSDIPFVSPYSFDPVSVRLNNTNGGESSRLKYITTTSTNNQRLSFSFAVILHDPTSPAHASNESPYFKVEVRNEATGLLIPGCSNDDFNPKTATASDSLLTSAINLDGVIVRYRKWNYYTVDLSSLPLNTNVSVNFEVGGCSLGSHIGYAYVDAECGGIGTPYANMCSGSTFATLVAPPGFNSYQWYDPTGTIIAGATNDTLIQPSSSSGSTYSVTMISPGGCVLSQTVTVGQTIVTITNLNATSSCAGGNSGTAYVQASGSNSVYTYSWTNTGTGAFVGSSQIVTGLAPGTYSVLVSSTTCGQESANFSVGVSPPFFVALTKSFCGNATIISQLGGTNYVWYKNSIKIPASTNDSLFINNPIANDVYTVVYNNSQGCRDSVKYTLNSISGGYSYFSNTSNVCLGGTNGTTELNLNTPFSPPYSFSVIGPTSSNTITSSTGSSTTLSLTSLAAGTYSASVSDGVCIYNNTVTIEVIQTNFTITPTHTILCYPEATTVNFNFETTPTSCGLSASSSCLSSSIITVGTSTTSGSSYAYSPYGGLWESQKNQFLFRTSELLAAGVVPGKINSIAFKVTNTNGYLTIFENFTIKLKCVSYNVLSTTSMDNSGLVQVYNPTTVNATVGWNTYNFSQSYDWDGTSNLLVDVCFFNPGWDGNLSVEYSNPGYLASKYVNDDDIDQCPLTTINGTGTTRPNVRFGNCRAPSATDYSIAVSSNGTITTNYANDSIRISPVSMPTGNGSVVYTFSVTNPVGGCVATQTLQVLYPPLATSITAVATNTILCQGDSTTLSASGAFNYNWFYLQGSTLVPISSSSNSISVVPPTIGINTYVVTGTGPCSGSTSDTKTITITVTPKATLLVAPLQDVTKCMNKSFVLTTSVSSSIPSNPGTPYTYSWTTLPSNTPAPGATNSPSYTITSNTTSTFVVTVSGVCAYSASDTIVVSNFVDDLGITINDSSSTCAGIPFVLNASASGGYPAYNYQWTMVPNTNVISNTSVLNYISPDTEGNYTFAVLVGDSCGYTRTTYQVISVLPPCSVVIPNIITPNGDGANDFFKIKNIEHHPNINVTIFDRWGNKVYENPNYNNEWNGSGVADGTFFYVVDVPDDKKYSGFITVFKGK